MKRMFTALLLVVFLIPANVSAQRIMRQLGKLKGYTIVDTGSVEKVLEDKDRDKYIKLDNGMLFKVEYLLLDPLEFTDVVIFAKPYPPDLRNKYQGKVPDSLLYSYKLLVDNEIYDATPIVR